jgi:hypothetical protein
MGLRAAPAPWRDWAPGEEFSGRIHIRWPDDLIRSSDPPHPTRTRGVTLNRNRPILSSTCRSWLSIPMVKSWSAPGDRQALAPVVVAQPAETGVNGVNTAVVEVGKGGRDPTAFIEVSVTVWT